MSIDPTDPTRDNDRADEGAEAGSVPVEESGAGYGNHAEDSDDQEG